jgi:isopentenyl diphosphate isomerase/L-lactate dehydrogenase-like FMN-dependent dehydrogenase
MDNVTCIEDLRSMALRRVPRAFFQYADHGSYTQSTLRANRAGLDAVRFRQRVGIDVGTRELSTIIAGEPASLPLVLAPVGLCGMQFGDGEILACRAAQAAGIPFCLSTMSICSIVLRALALGARSCMIGRAYLYGLGAGGLQGVAKAIEIIRNELDVSMALTGITSVAAAGPQIIAAGSGIEAPRRQS